MPQPAASRPNASAALTAREREVLLLVAQGLTDAQIADRLMLSAHTVHRHVANARTKLGVPSRAAAAAWVSTHRQ
jgi:DNA-binding CsgD family transcriptional regulator